HPNEAAKKSNSYDMTKAENIPIEEQAVEMKVAEESPESDDTLGEEKDPSSQPLERKVEVPTDTLLMKAMAGSEPFFVQVGAFRREANALALSDKVRTFCPWPVRTEIEDRLYKVRLGPFIGRKDAEECRDAL